MFRWINGRDPRQYGLDFDWWTRKVAELIEKKFGIQRGVTAVGMLLAKLGLTPETTLQRACQRDPEAIEKWQRETYLAMPGERKPKAPKCCFGTSRAFEPMRCMARRGRCVVRPRSLSDLVSANRSARPRPSVPTGRSGSLCTKVP